jgi:hypothetical protein
MSSSGTVVRNQSEDPETPRSSRSRLGIQEKTSNASLEDSAINLAEVMHTELFIAKFLLVWSMHIIIIIIHLRNICRQRLLYKLASERVMLEKDQSSANMKRNHMNLNFLG